jgi:4-hydroxy-3-polyprenylbenzoate decarboxylase
LQQQLLKKLLTRRQKKVLLLKHKKIRNNSGFESEIRNPGNHYPGFFILYEKFIDMDLRAFLKKLEKAGELIRISQEVSPKLEIAEIADRFSAQPDGGKALLFENTGTAFPVLINAFGSEARIMTALGGRSPDDLAGQLNSMIGVMTGGNSGLSGKLKLLPLLGKASRWMPRRKRGRGPSQEIVDMSFDLKRLPVLTCWPSDGGPFITLPLVHTKDPVSEAPNLGMYRMQIFGKDTTGMHWHMHKTGARHYREYQRLGKRMPVAVALGGDPIYTYCATAPLPDGIDEYLLAGFIRDKAVNLVKCLTQDLWVPDDCDIILEGYVDPQEPLRCEGPFGDHTGFYSLEDQYPVFHLTAVTHRKDAVYPATIVGIPPQEDGWLAWVTERLFRPMIKMAMVPEMTDFHIPVEGVAHNLVLAGISAAYPGQGRKVLHTLWGAGQMMFTKFLIVSADGPGLTDYIAFARHVSARVDPSVHSETASGPLDVLDHASRQPAFGGKLGIDATGPVIAAGSGFSFDAVKQEAIAFRSQHPHVKSINIDWVKEGISVGLVSMQKIHESAVRELEDEIRMVDSFRSVRLWLFFDEWVNINDAHQVVWITGSNVEIGVDVRICPAMHSEPAGMMFIDATVKTLALDNFPRPWPNPVIMDPKTVAVVDEKWDQYGVGKFLQSRSHSYPGYYRPGAVRE